MVAGKGWHGAARTKSQVPCQHQGRCSCSKTGRAWTLVPLSPGIDWRLDWSEATFEKFIPSFFCPHLFWNKSLCILSWDQNPPSPRPACSRGPADQRLFQLSLCAACPCGLSTPHRYVLCMGGDFCHKPKYKLRGQLLWICCDGWSL